MKQTLLLSEPAPGPGFIEAWASQNCLVPVAGVDEAGRGCLAGPVTTAAVILPPQCIIAGLDDSKTLSESRREQLFDQIVQAAVCFAVVGRSPERIDQTNILAATLEAMREAVESACGGAGITPGVVIVDGNQQIPGLKYNQRPWVKADHLSISCAAASILAKVTRDRLMKEMDLLYPGYGFAVHKGYGTVMHMKALDTLGPCPIHRKTFEPVRTRLQKAQS